MNFTFGIITNGNNNLNLFKVIESIKKEKIENYEIIVVGGQNLNDDKVKFISFNENEKNDWITQKKNLITKNASFENIVFLHDYVILNEGWYEGQLKKGNDFYVRIDKIQNLGGERFRDWCIWPHNENFMDELIGRDCIIPYYINNLSKYMYISGTYWISKKEVMIEFPLNETLSWGESEDVEWSKRIREKYPFQMNEYSTVSFLKYKDKVFNYASDKTIDKLMNIND